MPIARIFVSGSVDVGKSTLIGRLLYDSKTALSDHLSEVTQADEPDLAMLTDGLREERELKITIDVAYKYFSTPRRKCIIADTPGHTEFTRNMVTAASQSHIGMVLIDATQGITEQTRRHSLIVSLLRLPHVLVVINKMDALEFSEAVFQDLCNQYSALAKTFAIQSPVFVPVSAKLGDNVILPSDNMPWYSGETLWQILDGLPPVSDSENSRFVAQLVWERNGETHIFGKVLSGELRLGQEVLIAQSQTRSRIKALFVQPQALKSAEAGQSVSMLLEGKPKVERGYWLSAAGQALHQSRSIRADICWLDVEVLSVGKNYLFRQVCSSTVCKIVRIIEKWDLATLSRTQGAESLNMNDLAEIEIALENPIYFDLYAENRETGSGVLVDAESGRTVAGVMVKL